MARLLATALWAPTKKTLVANPRKTESTKFLTCCQLEPVLYIFLGATIQYYTAIRFPVPNLGQRRKTCVMQASSHSTVDEKTRPYCVFLLSVTFVGPLRFTYFLSIPDAPCMEYLPTFGQFLGDM